MTIKQALAICEKVFADLQQKADGGREQFVLVRDASRSGRAFIETLRDLCAKAPDADAGVEISGLVRGLEDINSRLNALMFLLFPHPLDPWTMHLYVEREMPVTFAGALILQIQSALYDAKILAVPNAVVDLEDATPGPDFLFVRFLISSPADAWPIVREQLEAFKILSDTAVAYQLKNGANDGGFFPFHWPEGHLPRPFEDCLARVEAVRAGDKLPPRIFA